MPDLIGDLGNPEKDAAALKPLLDEEEKAVLGGLALVVAPALEKALIGALDGLTITITVSKKA